MVDISDAVGWFCLHLGVRRQIFKAFLQLLAVTDQGGQGVGELADGDAFVVAALDFPHDVARCLEHVLEQFQFEVGEVAVLPVLETLSEPVLVGEPAS
ncbi:MAG: hypothetical protein OXT68_10720 [Chloroflexota bacterium]|nr:hypothetical protein [Chloroflexota bacterium]